MPWRPAKPRDAVVAVLWAAAAGAVLALRPLAPALASLAPACWFRGLAGLPCATCGSTHAALALAQGRCLEALTANPLAAVGALLFLAGGLVAPLWLATIRRVPAPPRVLPLAWRLTLGSVLAGNWLFVVLRGR